MPWARAGVEYVFDCTGDAKPHLDNHFKGGAKRVVVAGSDGKNYPNFAVRHNFNVYDKKMKVCADFLPGLNFVERIWRIVLKECKLLHRL